MQAQNAYDLPELGSNVKRDLSVAWAAKLRAKGVTNFVMANGDTYEIPSKADFGRAGTAKAVQIRFLRTAIRWAQGSDTNGHYSNYVREAQVRLGREGAGKPKKGLTSFTDSQPHAERRESKDDDEESVATTLLAPTVIMDSNSLASLPRRRGAELLSTSAQPETGNTLGSSAQHAGHAVDRSSALDPAEVMFGQQAPPPPTGQAVPQDQNSSVLPSEPIVAQVSESGGLAAGGGGEEKEREQKYPLDDAVEVGDDAGASSSGVAGGAGGGNVLGSLGVPQYSQDDPNAQLHNDRARRGLDPINRAIQGFTGRFPAAGQLQENFLHEAIEEMKASIGSVGVDDQGTFNNIVSTGAGLLAEFRNRTGLDPAETPQMRAIAAAAQEALQRGGQSQGAGGVGNIAAGPAIQADAKSVDANGDGEISKREFDLAKYNKALAYIHQFNPKSAQRMGSVRIRRAKPRRARMDKMSNQVGNVQQGIANYAAYRDVFNSTFA